MNTDRAQITSNAPQSCVICQRPIAGTDGPRRRGRPWRTHAGLCKRKIDGRHRVAAFKERVARTLVANGHLERAAEFAAAAAAIRAELGEPAAVVVVFESRRRNSNKSNEAPHGQA